MCISNYEKFIRKPGRNLWHFRNDDRNNVGKEPCQATAGRRLPLRVAAISLLAGIGLATPATPAIANQDRLRFVGVPPGIGRACRRICISSARMSVRQKQVGRLNASWRGNAKR
jgi:hypothetical protein